MVTASLVQNMLQIHKKSTYFVTKLFWGNFRKKSLGALGVESPRGGVINFDGNVFPKRVQQKPKLTKMDSEIYHKGSQVRAKIAPKCTRGGCRELRRNSSAIKPSRAEYTPKTPSSSLGNSAFQSNCRHLKFTFYIE